MVDAATALAIALLVTVGLDIEGGLPDLDLVGGIKKHRNILTHTILVGLALEFLMRSLVILSDVVQKNGFMPRSRLLKAVSRFYEKHHIVGIRGMWFGLFLHYLKDSSYFSLRTKPYVGGQKPFYENSSEYFHLQRVVVISTLRISSE